MIFVIKGRLSRGKAACLETFEMAECCLMNPEKTSLPPFLLARVGGSPPTSWIPSKGQLLEGFLHLIPLPTRHTGK